MSVARARSSRPSERDVTVASFPALSFGRRGECVSSDRARSRASFLPANMIMTDSDASRGRATMTSARRGTRRSPASTHLSRPARPGALSARVHGTRWGEARSAVTRRPNERAPRQNRASIIPRTRRTATSPRLLVAGRCIRRSRHENAHPRIERFNCHVNVTGRRQREREICRFPKEIPPVSVWSAVNLANTSRARERKLDPTKNTCTKRGARALVRVFFAVLDPPGKISSLSSVSRVAEERVRECVQ